MRARAAAALAVVAVVWLTGAAPADARARAGSVDGFFGVVPQAPLSGSDLGRLGRLGLDLRLGVGWAEIEPRRGEFAFSALDEVVGEAARRGVRVLPVLGGPVPSWAGHDPTHPPLSESGLAAWREFVARVVARYGTDGVFWRARADRRPMRRWQVWNEPNFPVFWSTPSPRGYVRVLRAAAAAIRSTDPRALVVAAGLAPIERQPAPWDFLRRMYAVAGARGAFDVAAVHPYSASLAGVEYVLRETRRVMARAGDADKPILVSEVGVASDALTPTGFDRGPAGQARFLERTFETLYSQRRRWGIAGLFWFAYQDVRHSDVSCSFCAYAGLLTAGGRPKPSWQALVRAVHRARRDRGRAGNPVAAPATRTQADPAGATDAEHLQPRAARQSASLAA